ncbi:MAG TPA: PGPGW domain-containing protein [Bryobacteraceae bacterium]|nr:PGPGW domain-containing protein [Bryobacteraceae bacterium]
MTRYARHAARILTGFALVFIGIAGLLLPIMPGWVFIIPGLVLLADYFPPIRRLLDWAKQKLEENHARLRN